MSEWAINKTVDANSRTVQTNALILILSTPHTFHGYCPKSNRRTINRRVHKCAEHYSQRISFLFPFPSSSHTLCPFDSMWVFHIAFALSTLRFAFFQLPFRCKNTKRKLKIQKKAPTTKTENYGISSIFVRVRMRNDILVRVLHM